MLWHYVVIRLSLLGHYYDIVLYDIFLLVCLGDGHGLSTSMDWVGLGHNFQLLYQNRKYVLFYFLPLCCMYCYVWLGQVLVCSENIGLFQILDFLEKLKPTFASPVIAGPVWCN